MTIREDLSTVDGHSLGIDDIIFSLKRLLILSQNTHGDFKNMICHGDKIKTIDDECDGIKKSENTLILKPRVKQDFLLPMLAAIDFAIIPQRSTDPKTLKINDYRNTSGPYYVEEDNGDGNIVLRLNPHHFLFSKDLVPEIQFIPMKGFSGDKVTQWFKEGKIDHITTVQKFQPHNIKELEQSQIDLHETIHIKAILAYVTTKGLKKISTKRRLAFAKSLQKSFHEMYSQKKGYRPVHQYLLPFGDGALSKEESTQLKDMMNSVDMDSSGESIYLGNLNLKEDMASTAKKYMPHLRLKKLTKHPNFSDFGNEEIPDYIMVTTDIGFLDDIGLLSYALNAGDFGLSQEEGQSWLKDYMKTEVKEERIKKIKKLHMDALMEGRLIPLGTTSWFAVVRKPWSLHFSELFANNQLWKIKR